MSVKPTRRWSLSSRCSAPETWSRIPSTGTRQGILDDVGKVKDAFREHQRRGIVFDIGHGAGSFSFDVAARAAGRRVPAPANISSDLHVYNVEGAGPTIR